LRGKMGDTTFTDGRYGKRAKQSAKFTEKQKADARERPQVKRTSPLNALGSPLRHAIRHYNYAYVPPDFWKRLTEAFRKEKTNHRVLLLKQALHFEADTARTFAEYCPIPSLQFKNTTRQYVIDVDISQPASVTESYNCYFLQFIMIVWNKADDLVRHMDEETPWLKPDDHTERSVTLKFKRTAADTDWILVCRLVQGVNSVETESVTDTRIRIIATGTVSPASKKILETRAREEESKKNIIAEKPEVKRKKKPEIKFKKKNQDY
jgi:hypothetical protein